VPLNWPTGVDRLILDEVDNTNDYATGLAREGHGPVWVMARRQLASRGRRGRPWIFEDGNFAASLMMWPQKPVSEFAQMSFVTALGLFEVIKELGGEALGLKWPNDVLLGGKKLSGVLLETVAHKGKTGLVIGVGVNLKHAPNRKSIEERAINPTSFVAATGQTVDPADFLDLLAPRMETWRKTWDKEGFAPIREAWLARAIGLGTKITARLPNADHHGVFEDIDEHGSLVLRSTSGRMVLPAADVYFEHDMQA